MPEILLTNDDGHKSAGFFPLLQELSTHFSVVSITPDREKSWIGKAITTKEKLQIQSVQKGTFEIFLLNGTPADCVQIGLYNVLRTRPKMVVSGINLGTNVGHARILSSGTIGAAMEASIERVPSIAASLWIPHDIKKTMNLYDEKNYYVFENAAKITGKLTKLLLEKDVGEDADLFSINIPFDATLDSEIELTKPFKEPYGQLFHQKDNYFFHRTPRLGFNHLQDGTDLKALHEGKIAITPISLSLVTEHSLEKFEQLFSTLWHN